jgi:ABC-type nitrate/sulfonate/bicarbonate transport system ATPase subunit
MFGPSGTGKTTWLKRCAGLVDQRAVTLLDGETTIAHTNHRNPCVYQSQHNTLIPHFTVQQNLALVSQYHHVQAGMFEDVIALCQIETLLSRDVLTLSGGEQQRCMLARTLLCGKPHLLLDEPFSALDQHAKNALLQALNTFIRSHNLSITWISHDIAELCRFAQRIVIVDRNTPLYYACPFTDTYQLQVHQGQVPFNRLRQRPTLVSAEALSIAQPDPAAVHPATLLGKISQAHYWDIIGSSHKQQWCIRIYQANATQRCALSLAQINALPELHIQHLQLLPKSMQHFANLPVAIMLP